MIRQGIIAIMMLSPGYMVAQEKMNIQFKDATSVSYDVESIEKITFSEEQIYPQPTAEKLIQVGAMTFGYDSQGRCNSVNDPEEELYLEFNYSNNEISTFGHHIGSFKLNNQGYFESLKCLFDDVYHDINLEYDGQGYIIKVLEKLGDGEISENYDYTFNWSNGNLIAVDVRYYGVDDYSAYNEIEKCTYTYSNQINQLEQWTIAQFDNGEFDDISTSWLGLIGGMGKPSQNFISKITWTYNATSEIESLNVSYTFNADGTIGTERVGDDVLPYRYASGKKSRSTGKGALKGLFGRKVRRSHK